MQFSRQILTRYCTPENVLAWSLGFVVLWFGINEILVPKNWIGYLPEWLWQHPLATTAVVAHGVILSIAGILLVINRYRRLAALGITLLLTELVITLILIGISGEIIVRDVGLLGMAAALALTKK